LPAATVLTLLPPLEIVSVVVLPMAAPTEPDSNIRKIRKGRSRVRPERMRYAPSRAFSGLSVPCSAACCGVQLLTCDDEPLNSLSSCRSSCPKNGILKNFLQANVTEIRLLANPRVLMTGDCWSRWSGKTRFSSSRDRSVMTGHD